MQGKPLTILDKTTLVNTGVFTLAVHVSKTCELDLDITGLYEGHYPCICSNFVKLLCNKYHC